MTDKWMTIVDAIRNASVSSGTTIRTDEQVIADAARAVLAAQGNADALDDACKEMIEALLYTKSLQWWDELGIDVTECAS